MKKVFIEVGTVVVRVGISAVAAYTASKLLADTVNEGIVNSDSVVNAVVLGAGQSWISMAVGSVVSDTLCKSIGF